VDPRGAAARPVWLVGRVNNQYICMRMSTSSIVRSSAPIFPDCTVEILRASAYSPALLEALNRLLPQLTEARALTTSQLTAVLASPVVTMLIARVDGVIQGTATVTVCPCLTSVKAWVEDVVVDESVRGRGLAKRLMDAAHAAARAAGADSVMLTSRPSRVAANQLYKSVGYVLRDTNVYRLSLCTSDPAAIAGAAAQLGAATGPELANAYVDSTINSK
jgi:GNAT superfamily N-acetyltransferase